MVRVRFRACGFGCGRARDTGNFHGFISGCNISYPGCIWAAFGPHLGRQHKKNTIVIGIPNIICSKFIQKWLITLAKKILSQGLQKCGPGQVGPLKNHGPRAKFWVGFWPDPTLLPTTYLTQICNYEMKYGIMHLRMLK